jgi:hypothetical protein
LSPGPITQPSKVWQVQLRRGFGRIPTRQARHARQRTENYRTEDKTSIDDRQDKTSLASLVRGMNCGVLGGEQNMVLGFL